MNSFTQSHFSFVDIVLAILAGIALGVIFARLTPEVIDVNPWFLVVFVFLCLVRFVFVVGKR